MSFTTRSAATERRSCRRSCARSSRAAALCSPAPGAAAAAALPRRPRQRRGAAARAGRGHATGGPRARALPSSGPRRLHRSPARAGQEAEAPIRSLLRGRREERGAGCRPDPSGGGPAARRRARRGPPLMKRGGGRAPQSRPPAPASRARERGWRAAVAAARAAAARRPAGARTRCARGGPRAWEKEIVDTERVGKEIQVRARGGPRAAAPREAHAGRLARYGRR
mmetsp:Transcript_7833/g.25136  ORF Transcript_7833/g.25136 Transcript_7833/m.25136 type:complete len:225 (-) Transcript_7833:335-1009(-)